jgi:hypothetical protein
MRALALILMLTACGSEEVGKQKSPLKPEDFPLTLEQAHAAIAAHDGKGCLRMFPFVECVGCSPRYRLDPIADGASVGPCAKSTFVAGTDVHIANAPIGQSFTWQCASAPLGGSWSNGARDDQGALVCR